MLNNVACSITHLSHEHRVNLWKFTVYQCRTCQFLCSVANASWAPRWQAVSTGPTIEHWALRPPLSSLFLMVWPMVMPVVHWRSHCRAQAVLILFIQAHPCPANGLRTFPALLESVSFFWNLPYAVATELGDFVVELDCLWNLCRVQVSPKWPWL